LRICVDRDDQITALKMLEGGANADSRAADGSSVLGAAVGKLDQNLIRKLLECGATPDGTMPGGQEILPWAIREGSAELVGILIAAAPDPHMTDREGNPLLHMAMQANRRDLMEAIIKTGADPGQKNARGESTLHVAIENGWLEVIPSLVKAGADPNLPASSGRSPLAQAVMNADLKMMALLIGAGADPNFRHPVGEAGTLSKTPLELAFVHQDRKVFQVFLDSKVKLEQSRIDRWLSDALERKDTGMVKLLLRHGAHPNIHGSDGWLPIERAVLARDGSMVKLLSDYGSPAGRSLHLAAAVGDRLMVELLLHLGMNPDVVHPPFLDRPLSVAIRHRHDAAAVALIRGGAKIRFPMPEGQTPLHLAVALGCPMTVKALVGHGADPNEVFELPANPAFVRQVRPGVARWALRVDRNVTPLMVAADSGNTAVARHLIKAGAKKSTWTKVSSLWPINFASRRGDVKMMRLILGRDPLKEDRHIVVNLKEQKASVFDSEGNEIFTTKVSTGRKGYATPTGEYVITNKHRAWTSTIYHASMPYFQRLSCSDFGLHAGVVPGYPASHGCIRVPAGNAAKLFAMTEAGDRVMIVP
jgi:ankyrin repeat protein